MCVGVCVCACVWVCVCKCIHACVYAYVGAPKPVSSCQFVAYIIIYNYISGS